MIEKIRDSNFEMLRILAIFLIVILHIGTHGIQNYGDVPELMTTTNAWLYYFIRALAVVAVNSYVLISGYFLSTSSFKGKKLVHMFLETSFFSVVIYATSVLFGYSEWLWPDFLRSVFSIFTNEYWFITVYFALYAIFPFLNRLMDHLTKKEHGQLLLVSFLLLSVWSLIFMNDPLKVNHGLSLVHFIFLYFLGGYIRKYDYIWKDFNRWGYLALYVLGGLILSVAFLVFGVGTVGIIYYNNSPFVIVMSYCLFQFFRKTPFKSLAVNNSAQYVLGIYFLHEHPVTRDLIWNELGLIENILSAPDYLVIPTMLGTVFILFVVLWGISFILTQFFKNILSFFTLETDKVVQSQ